MSIRLKLILGFSIPMIILVVLGVGTYVNMQRVIETDRLADQHQAVIRELNALFAAITDAESSQRGFVITGQDRYLEPYESGVAGAYATLDTVLELTADNPKQQQTLGRLRVFLDEKTGELRDTTELREESGFEAAQQLILTDRRSALLENIRRIIFESRAEETKLFEERAALDDDNKSFMQNFIVTAVAGSLILVALTVWFILRGILGPLGTALRISERIAEGETNVEIVTTSKDEIGVLLRMMDRMQTAVRDADDALQHTAQHTRDIVANYTRVISDIATGDLTQRLDIDDKDNGDLATLGRHLNTMTGNLAAIASQIRDTADTLGSTLAETSAAVNEQAASSAEQAASVSQTSATLKEIEAMSEQTLDKAQRLGESATRALEESEQGLQSVEETISGMEAIRNSVEDIARTILTLSEQSQQIGDISEVVTKLAQQSKILALNASIEAAKAGDAGKGFAVVAMEVKDLADQSQQSIDRIQQIVQDTRHATDRAVMVTEEGSKGVESGVALVQRTGDIIRQLTEVVRETTASTQQIVAAVRQEATGISQVGESASQIDASLAQNVASGRQLEEANASLLKTADALTKSISTYRIAE